MISKKGPLLFLLVQIVSGMCQIKGHGVGEFPAIRQRRQMTCWIEVEPKRALLQSVIRLEVCSVLMRPLLFLHVGGNQHQRHPQVGTLV